MHVKLDAKDILKSDGSSVFTAREVASVRMIEGSHLEAEPWE